MDTTTDGKRPSTQFDPLLRDLLAFNLVESEEVDGVRSWRLTEVAHRRLAQLAAPPPPEDKVVYFSRRCVRCGEHRPTRRRSDEFVCEGCWQPPTPFGEPDLAGLIA